MTEFKDTSKNNEETVIELQTIANMNASDSKIDTDVLNNRTYVFPNVSYVSILPSTQVPSSMTRPSNIRVYGPPQLPSPIPQVSESDLALTQGDCHFQKLLRHCRGVGVLTVNL